jgi:Protein of unknown function (DUF2892)
MTIDRAIRVLAGTLVLLSLVLFLSIGPSALWLTAFVGANLLQSAFTGFCPAETILRKLGVGGASCAPRTDTQGRV